MISTFLTNIFNFIQFFIIFLFRVVGTIANELIFEAAANGTSFADQVTNINLNRTIKDEYVHMHDN